METKLVSRPWIPQDLLDDLQMYIDEENDSYLNGRRTAMCMARDYLSHYFKAEEEGRLIELPCKIGTPVYFIAFDKCFGGKCPWLKNGECIKEESPEYCPKEILETKYSMSMLIDKTRVFLTREEAEAALKGD